MSERRFIVDLNDPYRGVKDLAIGTLAESPERPGVAHVTDVNGARYVAVWSEGEHSDYWQLFRATPQQIAAYERAPRAQVPRADPPSDATPPAAVTAPAPLARGRDWTALLTVALEGSGLTPEQRLHALQMLAHGGPPSVPKQPNPPKDNAMIDTAAIYVARRKTEQPATNAAPAPTRPRETPSLDSTDIYAARRAAVASWDAAIAKASNPERM